MGAVKRYNRIPRATVWCVWQILNKTTVERVGGADATSSSFAALFILVIICLGIYYLYRRYRKSQQLPGEVYATGNAVGQQAIIGSGYIEIPGTASYNSDPSLSLPYPLDPSQLPSASAPMPYPPTVPLQQPNAPFKGDPPPIGFVVVTEADNETSKSPVKEPSAH
ncbi:hypothetical protein J437_LFUL015893 [Ladona fulva]|uniref:Uncharacterized protein n=1 Tax=Ladona fulva TaxID=123851 RepID=A0A8K0KS40_LADFU|nr:hypothetical protein J437_LFUL015893 [Ladona fulva]